MRVVIPVWTTGGSRGRLEDSVPLLFVGRRNLALGYSTDIDVVFLDGLNRIGADYAGQLRDCGYRLHDAEALTRTLCGKLPGLGQFKVNERYFFLRWLVLEKHFAGEPLLHFDGDVVFNQCPRMLATLFAGRTMVLQGCPALTAISDPNWYRQYAAQLERFSRDVASYTAAAWAERVGWEESADMKWAGCWEGPQMAHDQDMLSHLIHTGRIIQSDPAEFLAASRRYLFLENPLLTGNLTKLRPLAYRREKNVDYLNEKQVAFWHMQSDWCAYLAKHMVRECLGPLAGSGRMTFRERNREHFVNQGIRRLTRGRWLHRRAIYERYFEDGDFREVLNDRHWWQEGVFTSPTMED